MLLIGTNNNNTQTVVAGNLLTIGSVYRKYCKKDSCGTPAFSISNSTVNIQTSGIYKVTATITFNSGTAGDVTFNLTQSDIDIVGASATETITTANTETKTTTIDYYILVNKTCTLGIPVITGSNIGVRNASDNSVTVTNYTLNVTKIV